MQVVPHFAVVVTIELRYIFVCIFGKSNYPSASHALVVGMIFSVAFAYAVAFAVTVQWSFLWCVKVAGHGL